jgi:hypothetical protein
MMEINGAKAAATIHTHFFPFILKAPRQDVSVGLATVIDGVHIWCRPSIVNAVVD